MKYKLSFGEFKSLKKKIALMKQKDLSKWIESIYQSGYEDGSKNSEKDSMDWVFIKTAIRATEDVSDQKKEEIIKTVEKLCFTSDDEKGVTL